MKQLRLRGLPVSHERADSSRLSRYSLRTLLLIVAFVGLALSWVRVAFPPTPRSVMARSRVQVHLLGGESRSAFLYLIGGKTQLSPRTIAAITAFNQETPVRGVIFKNCAIGPEEVHLIECLQNLEVLSVRNAPVVSPDLLTALSRKRELRKLTIFDSDLTGSSFPDQLPLLVLGLDDSIVSSSQLSAVTTYSKLTQFSAWGTRLTQPMDFLGGLTELRHVRLVGTNVTNDELLQLCDLPEIQVIDVDDQPETREMVSKGKPLMLHKRSSSPFKPDF